MSKQQYYDNMGAAKLPKYNVEETDCSFLGKLLFDSECTWLIKDDKGVILKKYQSEDIDVTTVNSARFETQAYVEVTVQCEGKNDCKGPTHFILGRDGIHEVQPGNLFPENTSSKNVLDQQILPGPTLIRLEQSGLKRWSLDGDVLESQDAPKTLKQGSIGVDLKGNYSAIASAGDRSIWLHDGQSWSNSGAEIPKRGDREGVLASYPHPEGGVVGVVYRYEGVFKKGLHLIRGFVDEREPFDAPIFVSSERNVGWDPDIFVTEDNYRISATDSTNDQTAYITVPRRKVRQDTLPKIEEGQFTREAEKFSFFTGAGSSRRDWIATTGAKDIEVDYDFETALSKEGFFEGRVGNTRLAFSYLEQLAGEEVEERGGKVAEESFSYLTGMVEFNDLFSESSGLRLRYQRSRTKGLANVKRDNQSDSDVSFSVDQKQYGFYNTGERGEYAGLEYSNYAVPSVVKFSDNNGEVVYSAYAEDLELKNFSFVAGYDPRTYAKRYELDYADWFLSWEAGAGLGYAELSNQIKSDAKDQTGKSNIKSPIYTLYNGGLETGYMIQSRSYGLRGFGVQALLGYRANGTFIDPPFGELIEEKPRKNELEPAFSRIDIWHGPFFNVNVVF